VQGKNKVLFTCSWI